MRLKDLSPVTIYRPDENGVLQVVEVIENPLRDIDFNQNPNNPFASLARNKKDDDDDGCIESDD